MSEQTIDRFFLYSALILTIFVFILGGYLLWAQRDEKFAIIMVIFAFIALYLIASIAELYDYVSHFSEKCSEKE